MNERGLLWIYDGKLGDVPHTNQEYAKYVYDILGASAMTAHPYCGYDSLKHLMRKDKGLFVLARTTNPYAYKIQSQVQDHLYEWCNRSTNMGLVVAGNKEAFLHDMRKNLPNTWFLSPGIGAQGGGIRYAIPNTLYSMSRTILNASYPAEVAKEYGRQSYFDLEIELEHHELIKRGEFTLASGQKSNLYIDLKGVSRIPELFDRIVHELIELLPTSHQIVGMATAGIPFASVMGSYLNRPFGYARSEIKSHGTGKIIEGNVQKGIPIVLIEDVVSTGGSLIKAILALREQGYEVNQAISVVDRGMGGSEALKAIGVDLKSLLRL
jgi:orotate phosphoribosyltransferase